MSEIEEIVKNNPFDGQFENDKDLHVFFLDEEMPDEKREMLLSNNNENEMFAVRGREIFCLFRVSVLDSLMGKDYIAKKLKISSTARNWRTVNKVLELQNQSKTHEEKRNCHELVRNAFMKNVIRNYAYKSDIPSGVVFSAKISISADYKGMR